MNVILLLVLWALGFWFFLGFWLEDCEGTELLRCIVAALLWPAFLFPFGCMVAKRLRIRP